MAQSGCPQVAIIGENWSAHVLEEALRSAGYSAQRAAVEEWHRDTCVAALIIGDGLETVRAASERGIPCVVVRLSAIDDAEAAAALCAGADAVVGESDGIEAVLDALEAVTRGEVRCSAAVARCAIESLRRELRDRKPRVELTARQRAVLELIAQGESVKQTARTLGIAVKTVENTQSRLYRRLGVRTRSQAIAVALAEGLIDSAEMGVLALH